MDPLYVPRAPEWKFNSLVYMKKKNYKFKIFNSIFIIVPNTIMWLSHVYIITIVLKAKNHT